MDKLLLCVIEHNPMNPLTRLIVRRAPIDAHANLLAHPEARRLMGAAGFSHIDVQFFLYLPESPYRKLGRLENLLKHVPLGGQYALFAGRN